MKKLIALLLVLTMCFGLCACSQKEDEYEEYEDLIDHLEDEEYEEAIEWILELAMEEEEQAQEPDNDDAPVNIGEDPALEEEYIELTNYLEELEECLLNDWTFSIGYTPEGSEETVWLYGSDAYLHLQERLTALGDYKDSQELAARFTVVENKLLSITETYTDALGNVNEYTTSEGYVYNTEGLLVQGPAPEEFEDLFWGTPNYEYDDSGKLVCLRNVEYDGTVVAILNISYNADGTVASTDFKNASGDTETRSYVYTDGLLTQCIITDGYSNSYTETYTYDESGNLAKTEREETEQNTWRYVDTVAYTYDAAGRVASKRVSQLYYWDGVLDAENYVYVWAYTYDDAGNVLTALETHLGNFDENGEQTDSSLDFPVTYTYNYGSYCVYTPAG